MKPEVSVIITTHNGRMTKCKHAIESVLSQSFKDLEVIVVDDASEDGTREMVKSISDSRIKYIRRKTSKANQAFPKNDGIKQANGNYICFLDSDNRFRPDHIKVLYEALQKNPDVSVVYGDRMVRDEVNGTKFVGIFADFNPVVLLNRNFIDTSDSLIRRDALFYVGGWDTRYKRFLDWNLYLRMSKAGYKFLRVPGIITDYYVHKHMISYQVENRDNPMQPTWDPYECEIRLPHLGTIVPPRVAVFTLTKDRLEYTKKSFKTLYETAQYPFVHVIVDNGSTDGTVKYLEKELKASGACTAIHLIINGENKGISIASNQALDYIKDNNFDIVVKSDNDAFYETNGWLVKMVDIWNSNHLLALSCYITGLRDNPGGAPRLGYGQMKGETVGVTKHIGGINHFVDAQAYGNFRWPVDETLHGFQDMELSQHLLKSDYQLSYLENFFCAHGDGTDAQEVKFPEYFEKRKAEKQTIYK